MFRKLSLNLVMLLVGAIALRADTAVAIDQAACCLPTTSRLDALMNPVKGGDEKFFSRSGGPPNILFIMDTAASMRSWPTAWSSTRGCSDPFLNGLGYDKNTQYDRLWTGINSQSSTWFDNTKYYDAPTQGYGVLFGGSPAATTWTSASTACSSLNGIGTADLSTCQACLDNQGYYIYDSTNRRVKGNFLDFYAPRDSGAVKVLADVVRDLREVRLGVLGYQTRAAKTCWGKKQSNGNQCLCIEQSSGPSCAKSYPLDSSAVENNRNSLLNDLTNVNANNNNGLGWGGCASPLADALYAAGYYFQSKTAPTPFSTYLGAHPTSSNFNLTDAVCFECGFNAIILLTDGNFQEEGDVVTALPSAITSDPVGCDGCFPDPTKTSNLHKVAKFLWEKDLRFDMAGQQRVATYTIGFSENAANNALLRTAAQVGGGKFFSARSTSELKRSILSIVDDIYARNTSFSVSAISTLQTQSEALTAIVPRMLPSKNDAWTGKLFRYRLFNEFVEDQDKNGDGDRSDVLLVDKDGSVIADDGSSTYRKVVGQNPDGTPLLGNTATAYWEASTRLYETTHSGRNILTVTDSNQDGMLNQYDAVIPFTLTNLGQLRQYLAVGGAPLCPTGTGTTYKPGLLLTRMQMLQQTDLSRAISSTGLSSVAGLPANPTTQQDYDLLCAALVMQYVRGQDIFDENVNGNRLDTRPSLLGDIFHSSPVMVDPPADKFVCDLGVGNQCVRTLYAVPNDQAKQGATPMVTPPTELPATCETGTTQTKPRDAYEYYQFLNRQRERIILVGANDGMLHAFSDGKGTLKDAKTCDYDYTGQDGEGGKEKWAFIPPDALPRLQELLQGHAYLVDGDIMVRDIWADSNGDGQKNWDEYRTVAVVSEGRGGIHYFALELKWLVNGTATTDAQAPAFRWMFPQPCTDEAQRFGKTLLSLSPKPPPIGPVLLQSNKGQERHGPNGPKSVERWVAMLSGGWSPGGEKGRGIYMVDVWNGTVNGRRDNLLWKWEFVDPGSSGTPTNPDDPRKAMTYGIVAPVALADYGANGNAGFDGFFDTGVVGDLGGQLWTLRFYQPGVVDNVTKLVRNWSGARSFSMDRDGVAVGSSNSIRSRSPYYYMSSLAVQPGNKALRAYVGTGNRYSLLDKSAGTCRFDNPQTCSKLGCTQTQVAYKTTRGTDYQRLSNEWTDRAYKLGRYTAFSGSSPTDYCGSPGNTYLKAEFESRNASACSSPSGSGTTSYDFSRPQVLCGQDSSGSTFDCRLSSDLGNPLNMSDLDVNVSSTSSTLGKNRFYGVWVYGGPANMPEHTFDEDMGGGSANVAKDFDARRLTDTGNTSGTGNLVNVTNVQCNALGVCTCASGMTCGTKLVSGPQDAGWFYEYEGLEHKTASGSAVLASCAIWNAMFPSTTTSSGPCSSTSTNQARLFQGDYISGAPNCAVAFLDKTTGYTRYQTRSVVAPPPEPATAIQVSKTGKVKYSTMFIEPGKSQASDVAVSSGGDVLQYIYELPVSKDLHTCRHDQVNGGQAFCMPSDM
ncbi:pilus assembly protein PilY [Vitiosangium sp. GDMCC 1.1324]|uniref:pilus assembly protein PilY n=1 Tax=Vitiosangium sp. (strain GDMCC 1.1324) TaxID=2138576 RepID=UPI000D369319|nr:pilus assembly protein PilY [Vitiosangium sp. GDMCC 1.1324]PTL80273.1 pilus assembly protein PilY [Vitiosangium sp. GDMCC 1.1324]